MKSQPHKYHLSMAFHLLEEYIRQTTKSSIENVSDNLRATEIINKQHTGHSSQQKIFAKNLQSALNAS